MGEEHLNRVRQAVAAVTAAEAERYLAIIDAVTAGHTNVDVGRAAEVTGARISQIIKSGTGPGPERAFWGARDSAVTIAVGEKKEAAKPTGEPGPVLTTEARTAWDLLREAAGMSGLDASYEAIAPPGYVALNRTGLIVVCGPRLSPLISDILDADDVLGFERDDDGFYLVNRHSGTSLRSPLDRGEPHDLGYLGRLRRPDGKGTFLYMGGLHAGGTAGAAHYLAANLHKLWRDTKDQQFSALIECTLTSTRHVASSRLLDGPYLHGKN